MNVTKILHDRDAANARTDGLLSAVNVALEAWDALDPTTRGMTGIDFLTAMEAMRIEVFR